MGVINRTIEFENREEIEDYLRTEYKLEFPQGESVLREVELNTILVDLEIEERKNRTFLKFRKPVSLKAFLLAREADMDVNLLIYNIDRLLNLSEEGVVYNKDGISDDEALSQFLSKAEIQVLSEKNTLKDKYRKANVDSTERYYDFNTIREIN